MKLLKYIILALLVAGLGIGYYAYKAIYAPNVSADLENTTLSIPEGAKYKDVLAILKQSNVLNNPSSFEMVARLMKYDKRSSYSGRYKIEPQWSNRELITLLRSGAQTPINVTINGVRTIDEMCGKVARYIEADSLALLNYITNSDNLSKWGYNKENIMSMFIPNSYEFYWNTTPEKFVSRMQKEHDKYWNKNGRKDKIAQLGITPAEAYTLASIVEKETTNAKELNTISGVYHNRLKNGIALQADPTVVFAVGDFTIRRVLNKHLEIDSPYNTYKNAGLPPGPIYMPSLASLEASIEPESHNYLYFCAKPGYENEHAFASSLRQHNQNAKVFHNWLNKEGIKK